MNNAYNWYWIAQPDVTLDTLAKFFWWSRGFGDCDLSFEDEENQ